MKEEELTWGFRIGTSNMIVYGYGSTAAKAKEDLVKVAVSKDLVDIRSIAHLVPYNDANMHKEKYITPEGTIAYR